MRHNYSFAEVLQHTGVSRNRVMRWADAGIVQTSGGGSQGKRREFSFRTLVEIAVCDELRGLGVAEPQLRQIIDSLNAYLDQPEDPINWRDPDGPKNRDAAILWIAFQRYSDPEMEVLAVYPVTPENLISRLTNGVVDGSGVAESGIAVPIARIVADLERATGDRLI
jgi:DNA-binding transcriptional MerR regulator